MDDSVKKVLLIMLLIVIIALMGAGALYVRKLPSGDSSMQNVVEEEPEDTVEFENYLKPTEEVAESVIKVEEIRSLILRYKEDDISFRYEFFMSGDSLLFTGWYRKGENEVRCSDQKVAKTRMNDVSEILERYIVASQIQSFRENPNSFIQPADDPVGALEITFTDGAHCNFGYPNGAGNALAKYCKSLTEWLGRSE